ncbi:MAG: hypothetical protein ABJM06_12360 [Gilvibacter sp.]
MARNYKESLIVVLFCSLVFGCGPLHKPIELVSLKYGFKITDNNYVKPTGDFHEVKFNNDHNLYVNARFYTGNDKAGPILESKIRAPKGHELSFEAADITVVSEKFGALTKTIWVSKNKYPTHYFTKSIPFTDKEQVRTSLRNDVITITVNGKTYLLAAPE